MTKTRDYSGACVAGQGKLFDCTCRHCVYARAKRVERAVDRQMLNYFGSQCEEITRNMRRVVE